MRNEEKIVKRKFRKIVEKNQHQQKSVMNIMNDYVG